MTGRFIDPAYRGRALVGLAAATAACWAGWMGWDRHRDLDPLTGELSGPYEVWQVAGCALSLLVVAVVAGRWLSMWAIEAVMPLTFTVAWSVSAATGESVGVNLWPIGAVMVLLGTAAGTFIVCPLVEMGWNYWWRRRQRAATPTRLTSPWAEGESRP